MFGALRFLLSYLVVLSHLVDSAYLVHFGFYAVRGFFVISGYIITSALNEVYGFAGARFWANRLLRLLPPYYLVCALTVVAIFLLPNYAGEFLKHWHYDDVRASDVLMNVLVLPLQFPWAHFRIFPPYWSIAVELVMYALLWLVIARREAFAAIALGAGIVYHLACFDVGWSWSARYFTAPSALLSFAVGALIYFLRRRGALNVGPRVAYVAFAGWIANMVVAGSIFPEQYIFGAGYYIGTLYFAMLVAGLAGQKFAPRLAAFDHVLGELAYPVFLLQWVVGFAVAVTFFPGVWRGWELTLAMTPVLIAAAYALSRAHERLIEPLRRRLRGEAQRQTVARAAAADPLASGAAPATRLSS